MDNTKEVLFKIEVQDNSKGAFDKLVDTLDKVDAKTVKAGTEMDRTTGKTVTGGESMAKSIGKGVVAGGLLVEGIKLIGQAAVKAFDLVKQGVTLFIQLAKEGDTIGDVQGRFNKNVKNSEKALNQLKTATGGVISEFQLMKATNQTLAFGVTKDTTKMAELWRFARAKAEELGLSAEEVYDQIVRAVGKGRDAQLKELGLTTEGYDKLIKKMGDSADKLTDRQKAQLLLNDVLVQSKKTQDAEIDGYEQLQTAITDTKNNLATELTPVLNELAVAVMPLVKQGIAGIKNFLEQAKDPSTELGAAFVEMKVALLGDKGLIKSVEKLMNQLSDKNAVQSITELVKQLNKLIDALSWLIANGKQINDTMQLINKFNPVTYLTRPDKVLDLFKGGQKQGGGWVQRSGMYTVGETGREKVFLPKGSRVESANQETPGAGNVTVNINSPVYGVDNLKEMVIGAVTEAQRNQNYLGRMNLL